MNPTIAEDIEAARQTLDEMLAYLRAKGTHTTPEEKAIILLASTTHLTNHIRPGNYAFGVLIHAIALLRLLKHLPPTTQVLTVQE